MSMYKLAKNFDWDAEHAEYIPAVNGYMRTLKPSWYTGRPGRIHDYAHRIALAQAQGMTELPAGHIVHHIDGDKTNNAVGNLVNLPRADHVALHKWLDRLPEDELRSVDKARIGRWLRERAGGR